MKEIRLTDGVTLLVDEDKFTVASSMAVSFAQTEDDIQLSFDLNVTNITEQLESKVQSVVVLRSV